MTAKGVIIAGGPEQSGGSPLGRSASRHLLPIGNRPILVHALAGMREAGIEQAAIVAAPRNRAAIGDVLAADPVEGLEVELLAAGGDAGPVSALRAASEFVDGSPFLLQAGDGLLRHDVASLLATVEDGAVDAIALVAREHGEVSHPAVASIIALDGARPASRSHLWSGGAHVFGPGLGGRMRHHLDRHRRDDGMHGLFEDLRKDGARIEARLVRWWSRFDGDPRALLRMNRVVLDEMSAGPVRAHPGCDIEGRVLIDETARVESSVIRGPVVIGPDVTVLDAYIGPYTSLGDGARVENAEVEHSIMLARAEIKHVGARLEGSVIGRGARVYRDFTVPRALRLHLGDGAQVALR